MVPAVPLIVLRKPELKPLIVMSVSCAGMHGDAKVLWITVWLPCVTRGGSASRQGGERTGAYN